MLPIDPKERIAFTPPHLETTEPKPVIWLRPMSVLDRARWRAALTAAGTRPIADSEMSAARAAALAALDCSEEEIAAIQALYETAAAARDAGSALEDAAQVQLSQIERMLVSASDFYRLLAETRALYIEVAPILALQQQCVGWQDVPAAGGEGMAAFSRRDGRVAEAALAALDPLTLLFAGWRAIGISQLNEADAKKSESPSSSPAAPAG